MQLKHIYKGFVELRNRREKSKRERESDRDREENNEKKEQRKAREKEEDRPHYSCKRAKYFRKGESETLFTRHFHR